MSVLKGPDDLELTDGGIGMPLFHLSLPLIIANLLQTAYNLADTYWLGQYGTPELAAISFAFPMVFLFISLGLGLGVAGSILVAQNTGADDHEQAEYAASQTVALVSILSVAVGSVAYFTIGPLLTAFGAEPGVAVLATEYMQIIALGLPAIFGFYLFLALMRGYGNTVTPMYLMLGTVILNVVLDPVLIFGWGVAPELGIRGAAIATVFARALATLIGLIILLRGHHGLQVHVPDMVPDVEYITKMLRIGIPASIDGMGRAVSVNLMLLVVGMFPTHVVAGYGIGVRIFALIFLPASALEQSVETMTGQNVGAGRTDRVADTAHFAARASGLVLTAVGVVGFLAARPITALFTTNPDVVAAGAEFLRYVALTFGGIGIVRSYTGGFRGVGQTMVAATISIAMLGCIRLPAAYFGVTQFGLGQRGIWLGFAASNILGALIGFCWFYRGAWRDKTPAIESTDGAPTSGDD